MLSFTTNEWQLLGRGNQARYLDSGHLLYHVSDGEMHAVGFDLDTLTMRGAPTPVLDGVYRGQNGGAVYMEVSNTGTLVFAPGAFAHSLVVFDRQGRQVWISDDRRGFRHPRFSPDRQRIAVAIDPRPSEIWIYDLERGSRTSFATDAHSLSPVWTPDGQRISYTRSGSTYWKSADGSGPSEELLADRNLLGWSPDERLRLFQTERAQSGFDIGISDIDGTSRFLLEEDPNEQGGVLSKDGRWLAYHSDESGRFEVYVRPFPDVQAGKWTISTDGGWAPTWTETGDELFYMSRTSLMTVPVDTRSDTFTAGFPELLFEGPTAADSRDHDVTPDGSRVVMVVPNPDLSPSRINVVLNWVEEQKARVPID